MCLRDGLHMRHGQDNVTGRSKCHTGRLICLPLHRPTRRVATTSFLTKCSRHATDDEDVDDNFAVLEKGINKEWIPLQAMQLTCFESIFNGIICKWLRWHALITSTALLTHSHSVFDRDHHYKNNSWHVTVIITNKQKESNKIRQVSPYKDPRHNQKKKLLIIHVTTLRRT